jgi:hypothetical protein
VRFRRNAEPSRGDISSGGPFGRPAIAQQADCGLPENSRRKHMVFAALIIETGVAVVIAGSLAAWARKRFTPRAEATETAR